MTIALAHATGNSNVRQAALALAERGLLAEFWTCVAWNPRWLINRVLPRRLSANLQRRALPDAVMRVTRLRPGKEFGRLAAHAVGWRALISDERSRYSIDAVNRDLDLAFARRIARLADLSGIYVYEDAALHSLEAARQRGIAALYELPIGYWRLHRSLLAEEREREPEWASTLTILHDSDEKLARKDRELALAERVIVPSGFVRDSLAGSPVEPGRIQVLPYGCAIPPDEPRERRREGPLRVLFVGGLSQRKGLSYLFSAMKRMGAAATLTVIGRRAGGGCAALDRELAGARYIESLPHAGIFAEMRSHDVLLFPTLFEGFSLVILEALAHGLVVITTPNSGATEVISDGVDGFVVPIRDVDAIHARLELLATRPGRLQEMAAAAVATARRCSWETYRERLAGLVAGTVGAPR
jgi:glycosyltransferase involved in cell wall biosynthesis